MTCPRVETMQNLHTASEKLSGYYSGCIIVTGLILTSSEIMTNMFSLILHFEIHILNKNT